MSSWFDIGVNLSDPRLSETSTITNAFTAGVECMVGIGTSVEESRLANQRAVEYPNRVFSTAGIHPHYAKDATPRFIDDLRQLASQPSVIAVGECGLDYNRNFSPKVDQLRVFEAQLALACELKLPVFLHERDAFDDQIMLLKMYQKDLVGGVAHCFTGTREEMLVYLELGLYIGITGWVCDDKRGQALQSAVKCLPLDRIVLETDAPYLFPKTLKPKSRTNVPANLPHIAKYVAALMEVDVPNLQNAAWQNTLSLFNLARSGEHLVRQCF
ncbi:TatD family hydrolase [Aestuariibacter sp. AA17]|uniref:TatD family hydrolase n=1 Tax=Fluctibacter corallii TaxID=2984329 RepID=A0ABT3A7K0_9ALTE|nr:TatD family hydrolase [Aestuariibacter sp. AA17]MCV2884585.1 TatD family hydrolase [Aestuariibacter sp. AA17]